MKNLILDTKRAFNTRAYLILLALLAPAELAILPYTLSLSATEAPGLADLLLGAFIDFLLLAALGAAGLLIAARIGLGMPFIEGWTKRQPPWMRLAGVVGISLLAGIMLPLVLLLDVAVAPLINEFSATGTQFQAASAVAPPAWQGLLAAFSAGITEEIIFRLCGLSLLAWLGGILFGARAGRPTTQVFWTANIVFALLFSLAHLPAASQSGIPLNAAVVIRTIFVNGAGGLLFGWLYWSFGLESAILSHIAADVIVHALVPFIGQQADATRTIIAGGVVVLVTLVTILWSVAAIRRDGQLFPPVTQPGTAPVPEHFSAEIAETRR